LEINFLEDFIMEDNQNIRVAGIYLGVNSVHGVDKHNARIFLRKANGDNVDGKVPLIIYNGLIKGKKYTLDLTKANDPALTRRTWI
jgi:hypothetical protein